MSSACSSNVPASTRTEFLRLAHNKRTSRCKMAVSHRRVIREQSVQSSVVSNESYCEPDLAIANHHLATKRERIAYFSKEGKNILGWRKSRATTRKWVKRVSLFFLCLYGGRRTSMSMNLAFPLQFRFFSEPFTDIHTYKCMYEHPTFSTLFACTRTSTCGRPRTKRVQYAF